MNCLEIREVLQPLNACRETDEGLRVATSCLYPSFEQVSVYIVKFGNEFHVHDGGGAASASWIHGRDNSLINKELDRVARRFKLTAENGVLRAVAISLDWIPSAILSVANGSAIAANSIVEHVAAAAEKALSEKIFDVLARVYPIDRIGKDCEFDGLSGKSHRFDFVLKDSNRVLLLDAVSPHHVSVSSKYVSFADVKAGNSLAHGFAVYERSLEADDASLMQQVADLVPLVAVATGAKRLVA